jgi:hypothetical protein
VRVRWLPALLLGAVSSMLSAQAAEVQAMEVQQSSGFVEVLLPDLGWRQAVIGRQVPAGSVLTSWTAANARIGYGDAVLALEQFSHVTVVSLSPALIHLSLECGGIGIEASNTAVEIELRGMVIHIEHGTAAVSDGTLAVQSGSAVVTGAAGQPLTVAAGATLSLLGQPTGPVFGTSER